MTDAVAELSPDTFDASVGEGIWLVDFWAEWCAPCHALNSVLKDLAGELDGARVGKVEVSIHEDLGARFEITSLPTLIVFRDGEPVKRMFGVKSKRQLERVLGEATGSSAVE